MRGAGKGMVDQRAVQELPTSRENVTKVTRWKENSSESMDCRNLKEPRLKVPINHKSRKRNQRCV